MVTSSTSVLESFNIWMKNRDTSLSHADTHTHTHTHPLPIDSVSLPPWPPIVNQPRQAPVYVPVTVQVGQTPFRSFPEDPACPKEPEEERPPDQNVPDPENPILMKDYPRMLAYLTSMFPNAKGDNSASKRKRSAFEQFWQPEDPPASPFHNLTWFERISEILSETDEHLLSHIAKGRQDRFLLPKRKNIYKVSGDTADGEAATLNVSVSDLYQYIPKTNRQVGMTVSEVAALESTLRYQLEVMSHSMWVMSGLMGMIRSEGFAPKDPNLFNSFVNSLSMGLAQLASSSAQGVAFTEQKRRAFYVSHLPSHYPEEARKRLLRAPIFKSGDLFAEEEVNRLLQVSRDSVSLKSQQAVVDLVARGSSRSRSPRRSPRSSYRQKRSPSPASRSPKRVRFSENNPKSPPPSKSNFGK